LSSPIKLAASATERAEDKMRYFIFLSVLLLSGFADAADTVHAQPAGPQCELREPGYDSRDIACSLAASAVARRYTLQVNFSGSHDDTMARMATLALNGAAPVCEEGSKTSLMGEDGDVSLSCLFTAPSSTKAVEFLATVTWSHAQYESYSVTGR
jgi:hypothetical protein